MRRIECSEMGFEYQMRSILQNIRPNRQTLMFSATMKKKIEYFAREILRGPFALLWVILVKPTLIYQEIEVLKDESLKWGWLIQEDIIMSRKGRSYNFRKC